MKSLNARMRHFSQEKVKGLALRPPIHALSRHVVVEMHIPKLHLCHSSLIHILRGSIQLFYKLTKVHLTH